jgi:zinc protease
VSRIFVESHDAVPLATLVVMFDVGAATEPDGMTGLAHFALELSRRGAGTRDRAALDAELDALGASLEMVVGADSMGLQAHGLARHLPRLVELAIDVLTRPLLDEGEAGRLKTETLAALDELRDDDGALAGRFHDRAVFGTHPYGRPITGTEDSLERIDPATARAFLRERLTRDHALVGFAGAVKPEHAQALGETILAALPAGPGVIEQVPSVLVLPAGRRTFIVDKPERTQAQIVVGQPAPARAAADWLPLSVAAAILGGTFTSRLMTEVRVKRGWSYGASARLGRGRHASSLRLRVFPSLELVPETLELVLALFDDFGAKGVTGDEVRFILGYLAGSWAFELATPGDRLGKQLEAALLGLPADFVTRLPGELAALDDARVNQAIQAHVRPGSAAIALTATAEALGDRLARLPLGEVRVVPYDQDL